MVKMYAEMREKLMEEFYKEGAKKKMSFDSQEATRHRGTFYTLMNVFANMKPRLVKITKDKTNNRKRVYKLTWDGEEYAGYVLRIRRMHA